MCENSRMQKMSCPNGDIYSVSKGKCLTREQTDLFDSVRSVEDMPSLDSKVFRLLYEQDKSITCPMDVLGVFPYPFANTKYIKCFDAKLLIKRCRAGFLYSVSRKLCDIPDHIQSFDTAVPVEILKSLRDDGDIIDAEGKVKDAE